MYITKESEAKSIEYKEGFNPADIVHTICAYVNDIAEVDRGYLVNGVNAENGILMNSLVKSEILWGSPRNREALLYGQI